MTLAFLKKFLFYNKIWNHDAPNQFEIWNKCAYVFFFVPWIKSVWNDTLVLFIKNNTLDTISLFEIKKLNMLLRVF